MEQEKKKELLTWYNTFTKDCYLENNGIVFTDFGEGWAFAVETSEETPIEKSGDLFGVSITANHIHQAKGNLITGRAEFIHKGKSTQVIKVELRDNFGTLVTVCTVTNMIKG